MKTDQKMSLCNSDDDLLYNSRAIFPHLSWAFSPQVITPLKMDLDKTQSGEIDEEVHTSVSSNTG